MLKMSLKEFCPEKAKKIIEKCDGYGPILDRQKVRLNNYFVILGLLSIATAGLAAAFALITTIGTTAAAITAFGSAVASTCTTYFNPGKNSILCQTLKSDLGKLSEDLDEYINDIEEGKIDEKQMRSEYEKFQSGFAAIEKQIPAGIRGLSSTAKKEIEMVRVQ